jgi:hypothetical protein
MVNGYTAISLYRWKSGKSNNRFLVSHITTSVSSAHQPPVQNPKMKQNIACEEISMKISNVSFWYTSGYFWYMEAEIIRSKAKQLLKLRAVSTLEYQILFGDLLRHSLTVAGVGCGSLLFHLLGGWCSPRHQAWDIHSMSGDPWLGQWK